MYFGGIQQDGQRYLHIGIYAILISTPRHRDKTLYQVVEELGVR